MEGWGLSGLGCGLKSLIAWTVWGLKLSLCGGSVRGMKRKPEKPGDAEFAMWIVERWEVMNLQLTQLAVTFIGFLGVELALIAQAEPKDFNNFEGASLIGAIAVLALMIAIVLFLWVIISDKFLIPGSSELRDFYWNNPRGEKNPAEYFLLSTEMAHEDLFASLEEENRKLNRTYMPGIYISALGQVLIALLLIARWILS